MIFTVVLPNVSVSIFEHAFCKSLICITHNPPPSSTRYNADRFIWLQYSVLNSYYCHNYDPPSTPNNWYSIPIEKHTHTSSKTNETCAFILPQSMPYPFPSRPGVRTSALLLPTNRSLAIRPSEKINPATHGNHIRC